MTISSVDELTGNMLTPAGHDGSPSNFFYFVYQDYPLRSNAAFKKEALKYAIILHI